VRQVNGGVLKGGVLKGLSGLVMFLLGPCLMGLGGYLFNDNGAWEWVVVFLAGPVVLVSGAVLMRETPFAFEAGVMRRQARRANAKVSLADTGWAMFAGVAGVWTLGAGLSIVRRTPAFLETVRHPERFSADLGGWNPLVGTVVLVGGVALGLGWLLLPYTLMRGAWLRTVWGHSEELAAEAADPQVAGSEPELSTQSQRMLTVMMRLSVVLVLLLVAAFCYQMLQIYR
jgi:hypothetical protein